ncbi:MAG TPA: ArsI/CadI family heavy metal resistance metalloenzyme [Nitriliruptorales bacterium]|jgi:catechol 2,3-dioxygenase-like lactoylglutathione lyase family enzyme
MTTTNTMLATPQLATGQARLQLALNVTDLEAAIGFYEKLFDTPVTKRRDGYANFAIANPPLKLVLFENTEGATINHLGVEVSSSLEVEAATRRLNDEGLEPTAEEGVTCCHALQDKAWVTDPDGAPWEVYTVLADADTTAMEHASGCGPGCC